MFPNDRRKCLLKHLNCIKWYSIKYNLDMILSISAIVSSNIF